VSAIRLEGVTKSFARGKVIAVAGVDLTIADGEFFVLLGPSGCGKTTLLRTIAGLELADRGRIRLGDRDVTHLPPRRRDIAMVFQSYAVFPHLTVAENIGFGLRMRKQGKTTVAEKVRWAAELVELADHLDRYPSALSGGQRQRVAVARSIAVEPSVLLMDEPLSNLDALLRLTFRSDLKRLAKELRTTIVYVTHDQAEALSLGDRVAVMREGQIVQVDAPMRVYDHPATRFVGGFIGNPPMNFLPVRIDRDGGPRGRIDEQEIALPAGVAGYAGDELLAGIRAENLEPTTGPAPHALAATVRVVEPLGSQLLVTVVVGEHVVKLLTANEFPVKDGAPLWLAPAPDKIRWFCPETEAEVRFGEADPAAAAC
jgi:multiple sugar transport system ATP-binding protein